MYLQFIAFVSVIAFAQFGFADNVKQHNGYMDPNDIQWQDADDGPEFSEIKERQNYLKKEQAAPAPAPTLQKIEPLPVVENVVTPVEVKKPVVKKVKARPPVVVATPVAVPVSAPAPKEVVPQIAPTRQSLKPIAVVEETVTVPEVAPEIPAPTVQNLKPIAVVEESVTVPEPVPEAPPVNPPVAVSAKPKVPPISEWPRLPAPPPMAAVPVTPPAPAPNPEPAPAPPAPQPQTAAAPPPPPQPEPVVEEPKKKDSPSAMCDQPLPKIRSDAGYAGLKAVRCLLENGFIRRATAEEISSYITEIEKNRGEVIPEHQKTYMGSGIHRHKIISAPSFQSEMKKLKKSPDEEEKQMLWLTIGGGTYVAIRKFSIPYYLGGSNSVTFIVPAGVESPDGYEDLCHSRAYDLNRTPTCVGVQCETERLIRAGMRPSPGISKVKCHDGEIPQYAGGR